MYMLFDPSAGLAEFMQLTYLSVTFKLFIIVLATGGFAVAYVSERSIFIWLARIIGNVYAQLRPSHKKKRKEYKLLLEKMRI